MQNLVFQGGTTRRSTGPSLNTKNLVFQGGTTRRSTGPSLNTKNLVFQGGTARRSTEPSLNAEPARSPGISLYKTEISTWWPRTSTRAHSMPPRKPCQEEQEETIDHTGVKNYTTTRMHCQKAEQQQKLGAMHGVMVSMSTFLACHQC